MASESRYMSIKVACVAIGISHNAREVCAVAVVDEEESVLLVKKVKPKSRVVSYLTPLTGVRSGDLDDADSLEDVVRDVKILLGPDVVLVGQVIKKDIECLGLEQDRDYASTIKLEEMFKAYNSRYGTTNYFTLSHEANTLIHRGI